MRTAGLLKRALKEIHALGGDYVQILVGAKEAADTSPLAPGTKVC